MDLQSLWVTNREVLENMNDSEYKCKEKEIIESLFFGTRNMIKLILKHKNNLSYIQQNQLLKILKKPIIPKQNYIKKKTNSNINVNPDGDLNEKKIALTLNNLNNNCLSSIFIFLTQKERRMFSATSRMTCVAAKHKKSYSNSQILQFPFKKSFDFIHKMCEIKYINIDKNENNQDLVKLMHESELLCSWIKNECYVDDYPIYNILKNFAKSGLLPIFSNLLLNQQIIKHHIKLIANILFLFKALSEFSCFCLWIVNANIIENLSFFLFQIENMVDKADPDVSDVLMQNEMIPYAYSVTIISNLYFDDTNFRSSISERVFKSDIIMAIIMILERKWTQNVKDLSWIRNAIYLTLEWMYLVSWEHDRVIKNIVAPFMNKISDLIDVKYNRQWIYKLLSKGDDIIIKDHNNNNDIDELDLEQDDIFTVSEIVEFPSNYNSIGMITFLGKFIDAINPQQKLCVELNDIHIVVDGQDGVYHSMLEIFRALCLLLLANKRCNNIDFESNQYKQITTAIKQILQVSQTQFADVSHQFVILTLLNADWDFFMQFIGDEIEAQFTHHHTRKKQNLYYLIDVAYYCDKLDGLCKVQWFKQLYCQDRYIWQVKADYLPQKWNEHIFTALLKNFCCDYESYCQLHAVLTRLDFSTMDYQYFVNENGVSYLLEIIITLLEHDTLSTQLDNSMLRICQRLLVQLFICLVDTQMREKILKDDKKIGILKEIYWVTLESVLDKKKKNEKYIKNVLQEMDWFLAEYESDPGVSDELRDTLLELQTNDFKDNQIIILLNNVVSSI